jgi:Kef-type K+ transport system membrane component KefB
MEKLNNTDLVALLLAIGTMLILSRIVAELGKRWKMPVVMGELLVGIVLGPTVLGTLNPDLFGTLFPLKTNPHFSIALDGIVSLSVILLLFVAGMEVQLPVVLRQGKAAITTGLGSMIIPFTTGFAIAWWKPEWFGLTTAQSEGYIFPIFLGTALSISALPVIARILMDLNLFKTNIGMIIIASAMFNDLIGWLVFSFILSYAGKNGAEHMSVWTTVFAILAFGAFMLFVGRKLIDKALPWVQTKLSWPGGVLALCMSVCMFSAAFTESIHIHAILGAFIAGIAIGDSVHLREQAREIIHQFVTNFFAPLFFVSIGLKVNFIQHFDWLIVTIILVLAFVGKVVGAGIGSRLAGIDHRSSMAIGFGLNARGAMEIILGTLAYDAGLISQTVFVALVIMALITSLSSGPLMRRYTTELA